MADDDLPMPDLEIRLFEPRHRGELLKYLAERIALLRAKNDNQHDEIKTARLRGQIQECKTLIAEFEKVQTRAPAVIDHIG